MENGARREGAADEVQGREGLSMAGLGSLPKQAAVIWGFSWGYGTQFSTTLAFICLRRSTHGTTNQTEYSSISILTSHTLEFGGNLCAAAVHSCHSSRLFSLHQRAVFLSTLNIN
jgi:hypothetical protein